MVRAGQGRGWRGKRLEAESEGKMLGMTPIMRRYGGRVFGE